MKKHLKSLLKEIHGKLSLAEAFHNATKNKQLLTLKQISETKIPDSWIKIHFKTYPRLNAFTIDQKQNIKSPLAKMINNRTSTREFSGKPVSFETFFQLMQDAAGINRVGKTMDDTKRAYPSAGARFPLELYAVALGVEGLKKGLYHYNVKNNIIESLYESEDISSEVQAFMGGDESLKKAAVVFIVTGILGRTQIKYGDRGYRYMLIETGHLAQNICLLATDYGLGVCTYGGFIEDKIVELLDIAQHKELPLYTIAVGTK